MKSRGKLKLLNARIMDSSEMKKIMGGENFDYHQYESPLRCGQNYSGIIYKCWAENLPEVVDICAIGVDPFLAYKRKYGDQGKVVCMPT